MVEQRIIECDFLAYLKFIIEFWYKIYVFSHFNYFWLWKHKKIAIQSSILYGLVQNLQYCQLNTKPAQILYSVFIKMAPHGSRSLYIMTLLLTNKFNQGSTNLGMSAMKRKDLRQKILSLTLTSFALRYPRLWSY